jgi:hypothetical protein
MAERHVARSHQNGMMQFKTLEKLIVWFRSALSNRERGFDKIPLPVSEDEASGAAGPQI